MDTASFYTLTISSDNSFSCDHSSNDDCQFSHCECDLKTARDLYSSHISIFDDSLVSDEIAFLPGLNFTCENATQIEDDGFGLSEITTISPTTVFDDRSLFFGGWECCGMVPDYVTFNSYTDTEKTCEFDPDTGMPIVTQDGLIIVMFNWPENIIPDTTTFIQTTTQLTTVDPCNDVSCLNDGVCISYLGGGTECDCSTSTHIGNNCETNPCDVHNPCLNGGTCNALVGGTKSCTCADGYFGPTCMFSFRPEVPF